jgi:hypothetical protein
MLSSVLRSPRAVQVNMAIMRTFVRLREMLLSNTEPARKLAALEDKYDAQFKVVFDAIRELMLPPAPPKRQIGFHVREGAFAVANHRAGRVLLVLHEDGSPGEGGFLILNSAFILLPFFPPSQRKKFG